MKKIFFINASIILIPFCFTGPGVIQISSNTIQNVSTGQYRQLDDITGSWSLALRTFDENNNGKLEEEERKKGETGKHFYQFNADGSCLIHTMKLKGSYEFKNQSGKNRLYTYVNDGDSRTQENAWFFISVSKTELVLLSQGKQMFWIYKRV
ncbi:MAG TPA: hypothetical protein VF144_07195 [Chitinophagaceae bacterium]